MITIRIRSLDNKRHNESSPAVLLDAADSVEMKPGDVRPG